MLDFFDRAVDPGATRFRAIVVPVDTYADDDGAIGSIDSDQREADLHYIAFRVEPGDIGKLAASFPDPRKRFTTSIDVLLRGPELRDDVQALAANPFARFADIAKARGDGTFSVLTAHPRADSLAGMRVDFAHDAIAYPPGVPADERREMELRCCASRNPASYALYRRRSLGPIVERYESGRHTGDLRTLTTRPAHRILPGPATGTLADFQRRGARLLNQDPYVRRSAQKLFAITIISTLPEERRLSQRAARSPTSKIARFRAQRRRPAWSLRRRHDAGRSALLGNLIGIGDPLEFSWYEFWIFVAIVAGALCAGPASASGASCCSPQVTIYARWNRGTSRCLRSPSPFGGSASPWSVPRRFP